MKVVVLLSGGLDSTVCLADMVNRFGHKNVYALNMVYGQKHDKEMLCAKTISEYYKVDYKVLDISNVFKFSNCSLLKHSTMDISELSYEEEQSNKKLIDTYVPFRNGIMLSIATGYALSMDADMVCYGAHKGDVINNAYPDCSINFTSIMNEAIKEGTKNEVEIIAPYVLISKKDIVKKGLQLKVPFKLTWSCYKGNKYACGKCGTCIERLNAFKENGINDCIQYE